MIKNNKKTILTLLAYTGILVGVIVAFVFFIQMKNTSSVTQIYWSARDISSGTVVDTAFEMNYITKAEVPNSVVDEMKKRGSKPITSISQLTKNSVLQNIPQGVPLVESMFGDIVSVSTMEKYQNDFGFENPYYTVLSVDATNSTVSGFSEGQSISIEGTVDLATVNYDDEFANDSNEVYNGILTNKCVVHGLYENEEGQLTNVGVIVELSDYPTINFFAKYGELKYHDGKLEQTWETTNSKIMTELWEKTGFKDSLAKELSTYAIYNNILENRTKVFLCDYSNSTYKGMADINYLALQADSDASGTQGVSIYTPYKNMVVSHYNLDGTDGINMDLTGVNTTKSYSSKTGLYNFTFTQEGIYDIKFYELTKVNSGTEEEPVYEDVVGVVNEIRFIVEKESIHQTWNTDNISFEVGFDYNVKRDKYEYIGFALEGYITKDYFADLKKETLIDLTEKIALNTSLFGTGDKINQIKFFSNNQTYGTMGDKDITGIKLVDNSSKETIAFDLFRYSNMGNIYNPVTEIQKMNICYLMGLEFKTDYAFFSSMTKDGADELLSDINKLYSNNQSALTKTFKNLTFYDEEAGKVATKDNDVLPILYIIGSLWSDTFNYATFQALELPDDYNVQVQLVFDDETSLNVELNICEKNYIETYTVKIVTTTESTALEEKVAFNTEFTLINPTREGYLFKGWAWDKEGTNIVTGTEVTDGFKVTLTDEVLKGKDTNDLKIYAIWAEDKPTE